jgi:hypothetical protein
MADDDRLTDHERETLLEAAAILHDLMYAFPSPSLKRFHRLERLEGRLRWVVSKYERKLAAAREP